MRKTLFNILMIMVLLISGCHEENQHSISMKFYESYSFTDIVTPLQRANDLLALRKGAVDTSDTITTYEEFAIRNPLYAILRPNLLSKNDGLYYPATTSEIGYISEKDTSALFKYFHDSEIKALLPADLKIMFCYRNLEDKVLSGYAIHEGIKPMDISEDQIKYYEIQKVDQSLISRIFFSEDQYDFYVHIDDKLLNELSRDKTYTFVMTIDTTTLIGAHTFSNPPTSVYLHTITKENKEVIEDLFGEKVIKN